MNKRGFLIIGLLIGTLCLGACGKKDEKTQLEKDYELSMATSKTDGVVNKEGDIKLKADTFTLKCGEEIGSDLSKYIDEKNLEDYKITLANGEGYQVDGLTIEKTTSDYPYKTTLAVVNTKTHEYKLINFVWEGREESTLVLKGTEFTFYLKKLDENSNIINKDMATIPGPQEDISVSVFEFATFEQNEDMELIDFENNNNTNVKIPEITDTITPGSYKLNIKSVRNDYVVGINEVTIHIVDDLSPEDKKILEGK